MDLSLVIACYLDANHLRANSAELVRTLKSSAFSFELILVNDASPDHTRAVLAEIEEEASREGLALRVFHHATNLGRGAALETGFRAARGEICAFIDIDLEPDHSALVPMIEIAKAGAHVVAGRRVFRQERFSFKRFVFHYSHRTLVALLLNLRARDPHAGLKVFQRAALLSLLPHVKDKHWFWDTEILALAQASGMRLEEFTLVYCTKAGKASTVNFFRDTLRELGSLFRLFWALRVAKGQNPQLFQIHK